MRDLIISISNNSGNYNEKHTKIKFNSDDDLPLNEMLELYDMVILVRSGFQEDGKHYPQVFLDESLYEI